MQEASSFLTISNFSNLESQVLSTVNVQLVEKSSSAYRFAGTTIIDKEPLLLTLLENDDSVKCIVNCGNAIFANTLLKSLKSTLQ